MRATLSYTLPEEEYEFQSAVKGMSSQAALDDIRNQIFRPARKHGYIDSTIQELIDKLDKLARENAGIPEDSVDYPSTYEDATSLVGMLESIFSSILSDHNCRID